MSKPLKIAAIVPAYNAATLIPKCLAGLLAQKLYPGFELEIIVVDDGSTDETAQTVRNYAKTGVKLVQIAHGGAAAARNAGVKAAAPDCRLILFTDADCVPAPDWATTLALALLRAEPCVAGIKGAYATCQNSGIARFVQAEYEERYRRFSSGKGQPGFADTYSAAYHRHLLQKYPFDESLPGAVVEDAELGWRLRQAGFCFEFVPQAIVYHQHPAHFARYFQRKFRIGRWRVTLYRRYPGQLSHDGHTSHLAKIQMLLLGTGFGGLGLTALSSIFGQKKAAKLGGLLTLGVLGGLQLSFWPSLRAITEHYPKLGLTGWSMLNLRTLALSSGAISGLLQISLKWAGGVEKENRLV